MTAWGELTDARGLPGASARFFEGLAPRHRRSLLAAHEPGILEMPSRWSWGEGIHGQDPSRSSFGEPLRKAKYRILANS